MNKAGVIIVILMMCAAGSVWADNSAAIETMNSMAEGMNLFAERVEAAEGTGDYIEAVTGYADTVETHGKDMVKIMKEHPEWGENPPADVKEPPNAYPEPAERIEPAMNEATR